MVASFFRVMSKAAFELSDASRYLAAYRGGESVSQRDAEGKGKECTYSGCFLETRGVETVVMLIALLLRGHDV